jgi:hypothetical protein
MCKRLLHISVTHTFAGAYWNCGCAAAFSDVEGRLTVPSSQHSGANCYAAPVPLMGPETIFT